MSCPAPWNILKEVFLISTKFVWTLLYDVLKAKLVSGIKNNAIIF